MNWHALLKHSMVLRACSSTEKGGGDSIEFDLPRRWLASVFNASWRSLFSRRLSDGRRGTANPVLIVDEVLPKTRRLE